VFGLVDDRVGGAADGGVGGAGGAATGGAGGAGGGIDTGGSSGAGGRAGPGGTGGSVGTGGAGGSVATGGSGGAGGSLPDGGTADVTTSDVSTDKSTPNPDGSTCISGPRPLTSTAVCMWSLAGLPPFDQQKSSVETTYSDGGVQTWANVATAADCSSVPFGFYYDLATQPPLLMGCPSVCGLIRPDPNAAVDFLLECI
jgi:hypothetical protein